MTRTIALICAAALALTVTSFAGADANTSGVPIPPLPKFNKSDAAAYGKQIAQYAEDYDAGWIDSYSKSKMTLFDATGDKVEREVRQMILEGKDGDKSLTRFMTPADIRGVAALVHEHPGATDDSWLYLPASRRVRRISGANRTSSFQGTEFTYEDLSGFTVKDYTWRYLEDGTVTVDGKTEKVYKLEAKPAYSDTGYSKLIVSMNQTAWRPETIDFYDLAGRKLKTLTSSKWTQHHGRYWRSAVVEMTNHQTRKRTVIQSTSFFINLALYKKGDGSPRENLTEEQFTKRALETGG